MQKEEREQCVRLAAFLYVNGDRNANALGDIVGMSGRTLYRIANDESHACHHLWHAELDALGFEGPRHFRITPRGRKPNIALKKKVKAAWQDILKTQQSAIADGGRPNLSRREISRQLQNAYPELGFWRAMAWCETFEKDKPL